MSEHNITIDGGKSVRLSTAGKYCDRDIVVTATGVAGGIVPESKEWQQTPDLVQAYLDEVSYDSADYSDSRVKDYAPSTVSPLNAYPVGVSVVTPAGTLDREGYEQSVNAGAVTLYNDTPKKYTVYSVRDGATIKATGTLHPTGTLRQIKCGSASNVRDLGGWACDGGTVKYGKLFRGGFLSADDREVLVNQLGVRVDLDLRGVEETKGATTSPLGNDIIYTLVEGNTISYNIKTAGHPVWRQILRCIFDCAISDTPVYFHCAAGRDRTGTVACIIEALLGVSQSDIDKDYELTCFALCVGDPHDPIRTKISWSDSVSGLIPAITSLTVGNTFRDKVINWVSSLGFTPREISDFRNAMIDGTPSTIAYPVTKSTSANCTISGEEVALVGSTYTGTITVADGYMLSSVTVMMDGVNITASAVSNNTITIPNVSGDVIISAVAIEDPSANIPDYTMLEYAYVENEKTGEVDTGYTNTVNTGISVTFKNLSSSSGGANTAICGNNDYAIGATTDYRVYKGTNKSFKIGEFSDFMDGWHTASLNTSNDGKYAIDGAVKNDWNNGSTTATNFNETIRIFSAGSHSAFTKKAYQKQIEEFVIYENGSAVKTFKPCRRNKKDNVTENIGFFCIEDNTFHASTGDVKGGPNVTNYSVTKNPSANCNISGADSVLVGSAYTATVSVDAGYKLWSVTVTMGSVDISATAVSGNTISIASVTGNVVISATAEAEQTTVDNLLTTAITMPPNDTSIFNGKGWQERKRLSGQSNTVKDNTGDPLTCVTGHFKVKHGDTVYLKGITVTTSTYGHTAYSVQDNGAYVDGSAINLANNATNNNGIISFVVTVKDDNNKDLIQWMRLEVGTISDDAVITVNKPLH